MAALSARGFRVSAAKVGPDFIDPSYHALATGRASRSLDVFLSGESLVPALAAAGARDTDIMVIEGVMGLFDGSSVPGVDGSTAAVSQLLDAPVILVVDASAMSGSVAAVVHGFVTLDPRTRVVGVIVNQVGSAGHEELLREALAPLGLPVLGALHRDDALVWRERHLGLVPVAEQPDEIRASLRRLADVIDRTLDLDAIVGLARSAPPRHVTDAPRANPVGHCRLAVCDGPAFSFVYRENLELLSQAGAEIVTFDPLREPHLPEGCDALYVAGGFPEVYAMALADNQSLLDDVRRQVGAGMTTWAECGGYLWLSESLDGVPMAGVLRGVHARMTERLTLGYRTANTLTDSFFGPAGLELRGHEYHHSVASPSGDGLELTGRFATGVGGVVTATLFASYLHQHLSSRPELAENFVRSAAASTLTHER